MMFARILAIVLGCFAGQSVFALTLEPLSVCERPEEPSGLSGIAWAGEDRFYVIDDRSASVYPMKLPVDRVTGALGECTLGTPVRLAGAKDVEGCAWDAFAQALWVSDESSTSVRRYDVRTGKILGSLAVPPVFKQHRLNLSLEALTLSEDGLTMWTANEETLACDGARASVTNAGVVRLARFLRKTTHGAWRAAGQWAYATQPLAEIANPTKLNRCGVSALCALSRGRLLVLEREMSGFSFRWRIYLVAYAQATDISGCLSLSGGGFTPVSKTLLASGKERFSLLSPNERLANFEGMCLGPKLADARRTLLLISDSGDRFSRPLIRAYAMRDDAVL